MLPRAVGFERLAETRLGGPAHRSRSPSRACSIGTRNTRAQTSAETGLPGRPSTRAGQACRRAAACPAAWRSSRSRAPCPRAQRGADQVVVADRGAADGDEDVGAAPPRRAATRLSGVSAAMPRHHGLAALSPRSARRAPSWNGGDDLIPAERGAGRHQLIAGGEDGDAAAGGGPEARHGSWRRRA